MLSWKKWIKNWHFNSDYWAIFCLKLVKIAEIHFIDPWLQVQRHAQVLLRRLRSRVHGRVSASRRNRNVKVWKSKKNLNQCQKKKPKVVINDWNSFTLEPFYILLLAISGTWTDPTAVNANKKLYKCLNAICVRSHHQPNITVGQLCNVSLRSHGHVVRSWSQSYDREFQPQRC
jgi:hypothetical protein